MGGRRLGGSSDFALIFNESLLLSMVVAFFIKSL